MVEVTIDSRGRITIPIFFRKALNLKPGSKLILDVINWKNQKAIVLYPKSANQQKK